MLIVVYVVIALFTFRDYGIAWDEPLQATYGEMVVDYYTSGFQDTRFESFFNLPYYGPLFEVLPALVYRSVPRWKFEIRHLFVTLAATAGLVALLKISRQLSADPRLAAFAILALMLMPGYYGHTFFNSKDIPFAAAFCWSVYTLLRMAGRPGLRPVLLAGVATGLALGIRVGGVLVFVIAGASMLLHAWRSGGGRAALVTVVRRLAAAGVVAWIVMLVVWPWAHSHPIAHPLEALRSSMSFQPPIEVRFAGKTLTSDRLPPQYLAHMFAVTTPLPVLTLIGIGFIVTLRRIAFETLPLAPTMLLAWALIPPLIQVALGSPLYNGTRHFLFVYPAMALLAGTGAVALMDALRLRVIGAAGVAIAILSVVPAMVRLHPYQYVYYNALAGGLSGAAPDYDTEYWDTSHREAALWINDHRCAGRATEVLMRGDQYVQPVLERFVASGVRLSTLRDHGRGDLPPGFDYYVAVRRQEMDANYAAAPVVHRIQRLGTTLAEIRGGCRP